MIGQLIIFAAAFAISNAVPVWIERGYTPNIYFRTARSPAIAYAFGNGLSTNIGGIGHSTGISSAFHTGGGEAYGAGIGSANGNVFARGIGYTQAAPSYPYLQQPALPNFYNNMFRNNIFRNTQGSAVSYAQSFGNAGSAASSTVHGNGLGRYQSVASSVQNGFGQGSSVASAANGLGGTAVSSAQNLGNVRSAVSSAHNGIGQGYVSATSNGGGGIAASSSQNFGNFRSTSSSVQGHGSNGNDIAVSAAENDGEYSGSTAQTSQQRGLAFQNSGASSVNGPGVQAAHSHSVSNY